MPPRSSGSTGYKGFAILTMVHCRQKVAWAVERAWDCFLPSPSPSTLLTTENQSSSPGPPDGQGIRTGLVIAKGSLVSRIFWFLAWHSVDPPNLRPAFWWVWSQNSPPPFFKFIYLFYVPTTASPPLPFPVPLSIPLSHPGNLLLLSLHSGKGRFSMGMNKT